MSAHRKELLVMNPSGQKQTFMISGQKIQAYTKTEAQLLFDENKRLENRDKGVKWKQTVGNASLQVSLALSKVSKWLEIPQLTRDKLTKAVQIAPTMVGSSLSALNDHLTKRNFKITDASDTDLDFTVVGLGLLKYFNIERATSIQTSGIQTREVEYWELIRGIIEVYTKIQEGLSAAYTIELGQPDAGKTVWRGRVEGLLAGKETGNVSPIRRTFGFEDEWDHNPYSGYSKHYHIELNYPGYVNEAGTTPDQIARTIVHEASHRWAATKDVLYKHQSFNKLHDLSQADKTFLNKNKIEVPGRTKLFTPMIGREKGQENVIPPERWLENADSYAWMARRLWKKSGAQG
jgi:hypothetical protein